MDRAKWFSAAMFILPLATWIGCGPAKKTPDKGTTVKPAHEEHEHPPHGPFHGHVVKLGENPVEWVTDDDAGKVLVYFLNAELNDEVAVAVNVVSIDVTNSDGTTKTYELEAANRTEGDMPTASRFEIANQELVTILSDPDVNAKIRAKIKGKEPSGKIVFHKH